MSGTILIKGGSLVTMGAAGVVARGDLFVRDGRIAAVGGEVGEAADLVIDARGCAVLPGFVQTHVHLCQTLFRGSADDLELLDWLRKRVWPMEAAHDAASIRASARL
ncbi:MAG TPA: amidohydrolase family protein, partial [Pyrinomonadaceae bacterium]|nr:amidohydrolase family protein [Pyrinomonadaceae bacterium]